MNKIRALLVAGHLALAFAIGAWVYSSHRVNALNIGGASGNVDFWIRFGNVGYYSGIALWVTCVVAAIVTLSARKLESKVERLFWVTFSVVSAPTAAFLMNALLSANVQAKY